MQLWKAEKTEYIATAPFCCNTNSANTQESIEKMSVIYTILSSTRQWILDGGHVSEWRAQRKLHSSKVSGEMLYHTTDLTLIPTQNCGVKKCYSPQTSIAFKRNIEKQQCAAVTPQDVGNSRTDKTPVIRGQNHTFLPPAHKPALQRHDYMQDWLEEAALCQCIMEEGAEERQLKHQLHLKCVRVCCPLFFMVWLQGWLKALGSWQGLVLNDPDIFLHLAFVAVHWEHVTAERGRGTMPNQCAYLHKCTLIRGLDNAQAFPCHEREPVGMTTGIGHPMFPPHTYLPIYLPSWLLLHQRYSIFLMILLTHKELQFFIWCNAISITFTISLILRDHTQKKLKLFPLVGAGAWLRP